MLAALLLGCGSFAAECPIQITKVDPIAVVFGTTDPWGWELKVSYKNTGSKTIVAAKFGADFIDATGDRRRSAWDYTTTTTVKPNQEKSGHWPDGVYVSEIGMKVQVSVWLEKAAFSDGSRWEDDGSKSCRR